MIRGAEKINFLSIALVVSVLLALCFLLVSCKFTELVFYEHEPSKSFYEDYDIDNPSLQSFKDNEVLFTILVKATNNRNEYIVWLGLSSQHKGKSVRVEKAIMQGNGWEKSSSLEKNIFVNTVYDQDDLLKGVVSERYFDHDVLFLGNARLFQVKGESLEQAYKDDGDINIEVFYEIDGKEGVMNYELKRRVEKQNVYPT